MKLKSLLVAAGVTAFAVAIAGPSMAQTMRVGTTAGAPLGIDGFCGELVPLIAEKTGLQIEFVPAMNFGDTYTALVENRIDILCSGRSVGRNGLALGVAYTTPLFANDEAMVVLAADTTPYTRWEDFAGQPVGIGEGARATYGALVERAGVNAVYFATEDEIAAALQAGTVRAMIGGRSSMFYRRDVLQQQNYVGIRVVEGYVPSVLTFPALAVRNTEFELLGRLQVAMQQLEYDGVMAALTQKWALSPSPIRIAGPPAPTQ